MSHQEPRRSVRFRPGQQVDFIVVGSGAAGGVMAKELSTRGHTVLVLEQGPRMANHEFTHDEFGAFFQNALNNNPAQQPQTFVNGPNAEPRQAQVAFYHRLVGGGSVMFTANYWRFKEIDFVERSRLGAISGTNFADWPITYADLEPYYTRAEWELGVSGAPGPFDPPRSRPYPTPPLPVKSSGVLFERGARALGLNPQPAPMAILSRPHNGRPSCMQCGYCAGFGCEHRAKSSTLFTTIPVAEATGRCEVRPNSYVRRIETDARGRATGVTYFDGERREQFQPARAIVVCANGSETPRLLLLSASSRFPDGLANSSGFVGRNLMWNGNASTNGVYERPLNDWKGAMVTRMLWDFYDADPARGFYGGGGIDARFWGYPLFYAFGGLPPDAPRWGAGYKRALRENYPRQMNIDVHTTSLPLDGNRIELDPTLRDAWGLPAMRVTYRDHPDDVAMMRFLSGKAMQVHEAAGARLRWEPQQFEQQAGFHLLGTARMGNDPATSVVDRFHRAHDVRNLFICDGSSFVTSGRGQPTATIQALAFRAGEHIARFARRNEI